PLVTGGRKMNMLSDAATEKALVQKMTEIDYKMIGKDVSVYYGEKRALFDVNLGVRQNTVTALIGPSGCGKSTFLRCLNRMNDTIASCRVTGKITLEGEDINDPSIDVVELDRKSTRLNSSHVKISYAVF